MLDETRFFENEGKLYKADWHYDESPESPRDWDNLGTMVFREHRNYSLGDVQTSDFYSYFHDELIAAKPEIENYAHKKFSFTFPAAEDVINDRFWKGFIAGNAETGLYIDKPLFDQYMTEMLSSIHNECEGWDTDLTGGIPLDDIQKLSDTYEIEYKTPLENSHPEAVDFLDRAITENLASMNVDYDTETFSFDDDFGDDIVKLWKETKAAVVFIDVYEHSGITCYESGTRANDSWDSSSHVGFIYVDKTNKEYLNELAGEARDSDGKVYNSWKPKTEEEAREWALGVLRSEIKIYDDYLQGNVHGLVLSEFDASSGDFVEIDSCCGFYECSLEDALKDFGYTPDSYLDVDVIEERKNELIENSLPPMSFTSEKLEAVYSVVRNENSSLNKAVKNALLIDYDNKRFSFVSGVGYMLSKPSDTYLSSVEKLSSGKAVERRVGQLVKLGFKNVPLENGALEEYRWDDAKIRKYILQEPDRSR